MWALAGVGGKGGSSQRFLYYMILQTVLLNTISNKMVIEIEAYAVYF